MRVSSAFAIDLPVGRIDLYRWVTEMTPAEYESFAPAHQAMSSFFRGPDFFMVNVECIGSDLLVQHYRLVDHSRSHLRFYSPRSRAYIYRWLPVTVGVPWELQVRATSEHACVLSCTIGADFPSRLLALVAWANSLGTRVLARHLATEGAAFARSIEAKFAA